MAKDKEWLSDEDRLEPYNWRNTQREQRRDYEQRQTPSKWSAILTAIINYQNKHNGVSPSDQMVSQDTGLSPGQVQYHLREMEKAGLIKDSKGWPRIISVEHAAKVQSLAMLEQRTIEKVEEVKIMDTKDITAKTPSGRKQFVTRAREIAQAIVDHYDQHGHAPYMRDVREKVYGSGKGGSLSGIIRKMTSLGWLHHKERHHHDLAVTGLGRAALFGQLDEQLHSDMPINPPETKVTFSAYPPRRRQAPQPTIPRVPARDPVVRPAPETMRFGPDPSPIDWEYPPPHRGDPVSPPPAMEVRQQPYMKGVSDVDLIIELTRRGFKVSR